MKTILHYTGIILFAFIVSSCHNPQKADDGNELPRIAIAGIAIESSTFSPAVTHEEAFHGRVGDEVFTYYPFMEAESPLRRRAQWFPTFRGHAMPGGIVTREAYESMLNRILTMLEDAMPLDGLFLDIHGAMSVVGLDDPEGDMIVRIREVIGTDPLISTCMDLHGSVSPRLAQNTDLITCFRMAPHEDALESKQRAVENLLERLETGKGKPGYKAWVPVPILLPGEKTSTRIEPAKSLYAQIAPATEHPGIIDAAIWMSYPWADEPRNHGVVMVTGDDENETRQLAERLAQHFWDVREEFVFVAPTATWEECVQAALDSDVKPFIISDMGDNPTAGGAGDVTWTLTQILNNPVFYEADAPRLIYASVFDEEFVAKAVETGQGGHIDAFAGARVDDRYAPPVRINGTIQSILHGDRNAETEVVIRVGSVDVIVTKKRKGYHRESDFTNLGLNPREADILVVKIGYLVPELYEMKAGWKMALTPGGVDQQLERLEYQRIKRPMYPLDKDMQTPDLSVRFIPASDSIRYN
ncbi:MAG: M81 family peptidase [Bacteroidetes bacterium]|nr:MAG: M81 family peptidase [Bacteroidota bacterium]